MLVPSRQESFGLKASDSLAFSTLVVAFNSTGLVGVHEHKKKEHKKDLS